MPACFEGAKWNSGCRIGCRSVRSAIPKALARRAAKRTLVFGEKRCDNKKPPYPIRFRNRAQCCSALRKHDPMRAAWGGVGIAGSAGQSHSGLALLQIGTCPARQILCICRPAQMQELVQGFLELGLDGLASNAATQKVDPKEFGVGRFVLGIATRPAQRAGQRAERIVDKAAYILGTPS